MSKIKPVMPLFLFARLPHIEREAGFILAGQLIVDLPKGAKPNKRNTRLVEKIIDHLLESAESWTLGSGVTVGWRDDQKPENAVREDDDAALTAWASTRLVIGVRVDPDPPGQMKMDSDLRRQLGLLH
jgi:hypothetical protein